MLRTVLLALALIGIPVSATAERDYVDRIPNGGVYDCDNCHEDDSFKDDWKRFGWGSKLAGKDSDGDGFSNGEELQDPAGRWRDGQADPGIRKLVSDPSRKKSVPPVLGAPSEKKARCIRKLNAGLVQVAEATGASLRACVELSASGESGELPSACAANLENARKVEKRIARLEKHEGKYCLALQNPPPFGATSTDEVASAAIEERAALLDDLFGPDPDAALVSEEDDKAGARCQAALLGASDRCASLALEAFESCKAKGLKIRRIGGADDLADCLEQALAKSRARRCGIDGSKLANALADRCAEPETDLAALFPGCAESAPDDLVACVAERLRCRACRAVDRADALGADCDLFDDAGGNESCED